MRLQECMGCADAYVEENMISEIGLLKIDTEGGESSVLSGFKKTLSAAPPKFILSEFCASWLNNTAVDGAVQFLDVIEAAGYIPMHIPIPLRRGPPDRAADLRHMGFCIDWESSPCRGNYSYQACIVRTILDELAQGSSWRQWLRTAISSSDVHDILYIHKTHLNIYVTQLTLRHCMGNKAV